MATKMNKTIKTKWLKALRSGDYDQVGGALCEVRVDGASYCCLGVLCEVIEGEKVWVESHPSQDALLIKGSSSMAYPTDSILEKAGLSGTAKQNILEELMTANDDGETFATIADIIEKQL